MREWAARSAQFDAEAALVSQKVGYPNKTESVDPCHAGCQVHLPRGEVSFVSEEEDALALLSDLQSQHLQ
jgi:hypothetical protein